MGRGEADHQAADWQTVSEHLLHAAAVGGEDLRALCLTSYGGVLGAASEVLEPATLIALIPEQGAVAYFVPFVEAAVRRWSAAGFAKRLQQDVHAAALRDRLQA